MFLKFQRHSNGRVVDQARAWCSALGVAFYRFSPQLADDIKLDETDDKILAEMMQTDMVHVCERKEDIRQWAQETPDAV